VRANKAGYQRTGGFVDRDVLAVQRMLEQLDQHLVDIPTNAGVLRLGVDNCDAAIDEILEAFFGEEMHALLLLMNHEIKKHFLERPAALFNRLLC
jgi:hypothetical protein